MVEVLKPTKDILQDLSDEFGRLVVKTEKHRKAATEKHEFYKLKCANGEKQANEYVVRKLKSALDKI